MHSSKRPNCNQPKKKTKQYLYIITLFNTLQNKNKKQQHKLETLMRN